ncbi:TraR/DksA C4-type zinc finger protein [Pseudoalteromonas sp. C2R02]|uniref:TraR/DksA family transcriptional regulator n=1 Tax=Pseudoalteromonas sp. C2R02 TaxID=2841565 RepID=UPI001C0A628B|nr:TraR/DksA C4-type zinc finger protein [Pseudoalteromonas sp. C2R02]MBU2970308.1 TraR/DksA C4-type zinc finger protein [Pseudoalteromonas sp. C2R02]
MPHSLMLFKNRLTEEAKRLRAELLQDLSQSEHFFEREIALKLKATPDINWIELLQDKIYPTLNKKVIRLNKVEAALCQFEQGVYGICADCEDAISLLKLEQDPTEQRCLPCADKSAV